MAELGREPPDFDLFSYEGADHQLLSVREEIEARVDGFIAIVAPES